MGAFDIHFTSRFLIELGWFWWLLIWFAGCFIAFQAHIMGLSAWTILIGGSFLWFWGVQGENWPMISDWYHTKISRHARQSLPINPRDHIDVLEDKPDFKKIKVNLQPDWISVKRYVPKDWCVELRDVKDAVGGPKEVKLHNGDVFAIRYKSSVIEGGNLVGIRGEGSVYIEAKDCPEDEKKVEPPAVVAMPGAQDRNVEIIHSAAEERQLRIKLIPEWASVEGYAPLGWCWKVVSPADNEGELRFKNGTVVQVPLKEKAAGRIVAVRGKQGYMNIRIYKLKEGDKC